jgi:YD repeat-containing protein
LLGWTDEGGVSATLLRDAGGRVGGIVNDLGELDLRKYNKAGLIRSRKTGEQEIRYTHDREGRVVKIDYGNGQRVANEFDDVGRLAKSTTGEVVTQYRYDLLDRVTHILETLPGGVEALVEYTYTPGGRKASVRFLKTEKGRVKTDVTTTTTYDKLGRETAIYVNRQKRVVYGYTPGSLKVRTKWYANGIRHEYEYGPDGRPVKVSAFQEEELVRGMAYTWNESGQLTQRVIFTGE